jgi:hypothetical protein
VVALLLSAIFYLLEAMALGTADRLQWGLYLCSNAES